MDASLQLGDMDDRPLLVLSKYDVASNFSRIFFKWISPLFDSRREREIGFTDMMSLPKKDDPGEYGVRFAEAWSMHVAHEHRITAAPASWTVYSLEYVKLGILKLIGGILGAFAGPLLLKHIVSLISTSNSTWTQLRNGYIMAVILFLASILGLVMQSQYSFAMGRLTLNLKAGLLQVLVTKSLLISPPNHTEAHDVNVADINNLISVDTDRFMNGVSSLHEFLTIPIQLCIALYLLYEQVGHAMLSGLVVMLIIIPINALITKSIATSTKEMMQRKDERLRLLRELLENIRPIKLLGWERKFSYRIRDARQREFESLKRIKYLDACCVYLWATTPVLVSLAAFSYYHHLGGEFTPPVIFTSLALFNMLIHPLNAFPWVINGLVEAYISCKRIECFMNQPNTPVLTSRIKSYVRYVNDSNHKFNYKQCECIVLDELSTGFHVDQPSVLHSISLRVDNGQLIAICGRVGSGKTSLLLSMLGELHVHRGSMMIRGRIAYIRQTPWIVNGTIRDNILCGMEYNESKYHNILACCCLLQDMNQFAHGDQTEVGERGTNLSGGQRARINLARAVYSDADVYLLDDPLSCVDVQVAKHIMQHCIKEHLHLKTRILVTHLESLIDEFNVTKRRLVDGRIVDESLSLPGLSTNHNCDVVPNQDLFTMTNDSEMKSTEDASTIRNHKKRETTHEEKRKKGRIDTRILYIYCRSMSWSVTIIICLSLLFMQTSRNANDWWLSSWTASNHSQTSSSFMRGLVYIAIFNSFIALLRSFSFAYGGLRAARTMFEQLLDRITASKIDFFEANPVGRVLNRLSADVFTIDIQVPFMANIFLATIFAFIGSIIMITLASAWIIPLFLPLALFYYQLQHSYRRLSRDIKRLDSITRSPLFAKVSEIDDGAVMIRAMNGEEAFLTSFIQLITNSQTVSFNAMALGQWLNVRLQLLSTIIVFIIISLGLFDHHASGHANASLIGLALTYAITMTSCVNGMMWSFTETEKEFVAVERIVEYTDDIQIEENNENEDIADDMLIPVNDQWEGYISFEEVSLRYVVDAPLALNCVSFDIRAGEYIGIIGPTGAGKSSVFQALLRIRELSSGRILIDGMDIGRMSISKLRSRIGIIPQDPMMFHATIRYNLDPFNEFCDKDINDAIKKCLLDEKIATLPQGIDSVIDQNARNWSAGQRQLLCLARAILHCKTILCLDEATSSMDLESDQRVQQVIRSKFSGRTLLVIAHRLESVADADRILLMEKSRVSLFDEPSVVLRQAAATPDRE